MGACTLQSSFSLFLDILPASLSVETLRSKTIVLLKHKQKAGGAEVILILQLSKVKAR